MPNTTTRKIKRSDYERVLVTETLPNEVPIIVSNDGLYKNSKSLDTASTISKFIFEYLVVGIGRPKGAGYTIPYSYKIRKSTDSFRNLSLPHPISQWEMKKFYEKNDKLICHFCGISPCTLRAPKKIASSYFYSNPLENLKKFKHSPVEEENLDELMRYSSSYFSYQGYDRLYKFFRSSLFLKLEKDFQILKTLDVAKCFESIYTHSISWATKEKTFTKHNVGTGSTFGQSFDSLMQRSNYNETNGILIGPEISRIFAEVIFQKIDCNAIESIRGKYKLRLGQEYAIFRYVDDVYIFAKTEDIATKALEIYTDELAKFNLHANKLKEKYYKRPFFTQKSRVIKGINAIINGFIDKFLERPSPDTLSLIPKEIFFPNRLIRSFIDEIKLVCSTESLPYDEISPYVISSLYNRARWLINLDADKISDDNSSNIKDACVVLIELIFFFYAVAPTVSASYKLCSAIIFVSRFAETTIKAHEHTVKQRIFELSLELLSGDIAALQAGVDRFVLLEAINVLLATRDLGTDYLMPEAIIEKLCNTDASYFHLVSYLFYIKDHSRYAALRLRVIDAIDAALSKLDDVHVDSEKACLLLDALACRFIPEKQKKKWVAGLCAAASKPRPSTADFDAFFLETNNRHWFVNWDQVDLLSALEKKELKRAY
ncbi:antiviral reverse transcriptase Drt3b [Burkholderia pyrrocinia]|uniref:antiviral reverse transcriptase Drt3b n=1 Tax=Burkholderia pyrrocinia TaxID=60550 RepID=UPI00158C593B|nr:antiviral reverse transcriptase Drt3b [Burkholderia pyrrocinia]